VQREKVPLGDFLSAFLPDFGIEKSFPLAVFLQWFLQDHVPIETRWGVCGFRRFDPNKVARARENYS
jgi:hypothetical protein